MIKAEEFTTEELEAIVSKLTDFKNIEDHLKGEVTTYFSQFDKDQSGFLDRKELREFLRQFFTLYKIHFPVTDEYVDAVFREIDENKDNKIQLNELEHYAMHFVNTILPEYVTVLQSKQQ